MARAATTSDAFNAVAEPRRRDILSYLALHERPVSDIVSELGLAQPSVSKHLRVLLEVGLVEARREGRNMFIGPMRTESGRSTSGPRLSSASGSTNCCASRSAPKPRSKARSEID